MLATLFEHWNSRRSPVVVYTVCDQYHHSRGRNTLLPIGVSVKKIRCVRWLWLLLSVVWFVFDILTKQWVMAWASWGEPHVVTSFFNITLAFNRGMAFGWLNDHSGWQLVVLSGLAVVVSLVLLYVILTNNSASRWSLAGMASLIGGALGNAWDRVLHGSVIDFLDFHAVGWHFWTFNVADVAVSVGVICLILDWIINSSHTNNASLDATS